MQLIYTIKRMTNSTGTIFTIIVCAFLHNNEMGIWPEKKYHVLIKFLNKYYIPMDIIDF
jgi:hypothetical protein